MAFLNDLILKKSSWKFPLASLDLTTKAKSANSCEHSKDLNMHHKHGILELIPIL